MNTRMKQDESSLHTRLPFNITSSDRNIEHTHIGTSNSVSHLKMSTKPITVFVDKQLHVDNDEVSQNVHTGLNPSMEFDDKIVYSNPLNNSIRNNRTNHHSTDEQKYNSTLVLKQSLKNHQSKTSYQEIKNKTFEKPNITFDHKKMEPSEQTFKLIVNKESTRAKLHQYKANNKVEGNGSINSCVQATEIKQQRKNLNLDDTYPISSTHREQYSHMDNLKNKQNVFGLYKDNFKISVMCTDAVVNTDSFDNKSDTGKQFPNSVEKKSNNCHNLKKSNNNLKEEVLIYEPKESLFVNTQNVEVKTQNFVGSTSTFLNELNCNPNQDGGLSKTQSDVKIHNYLACNQNDTTVYFVDETTIKNNPALRTDGNVTIDRKEKSNCGYVNEETVRANSIDMFNCSTSTLDCKTSAMDIDFSVHQFVIDNDRSHESNNNTEVKTTESNQNRREDSLKVITQIFNKNTVKEQISLKQSTLTGWKISSYPQNEKIINNGNKIQNNKKKQIAKEVLKGKTKQKHTGHTKNNQPVNRIQEKCNPVYSDSMNLSSPKSQPILYKIKRARFVPPVFSHQNSQVIIMLILYQHILNDE